MRGVWQAADAIGWPFGPLIKLLILTGQRREEVAAMRWSEIDLEAMTWTIPNSRAKNKVEHAVPLSDQALEILNGLPRVASKAGYVFTTNGVNPVSGFARAKQRLDGELAKTVPGMAPWVIHDLRRTFASGVAGLHIDLPVIEKVLNHISGSFKGIVGVYQRHSFADEKRAALETWGRHVEALVSGGGAANVVELAKARA